MTPTKPAPLFSIKYSENRITVTMADGETRTFGGRTAWNRYYRAFSRVLRDNGIPSLLQSWICLFLASLDGSGRKEERPEWDEATLDVAGSDRSVVTFRRGEKTHTERLERFVVRAGELAALRLRLRAALSDGE